MAKLETTYGTDSLPVGGTDDIKTYDSAVVAQPNAERFEFRPHSSSFTRQSDIIAMRWVDLTFRTLLETSGVNGSIGVNGFAALDALLSACACTSTTLVGPPAQIVYKPSTIAALESATVYVNHSAHVHKVPGAIGNCILSGNPRGGIQADFRMQGLYVAPVAVGTLFNGWTGGTKRAQPFLGLTLPTINNGSALTAFVFRSFTHDFGVQIIRIENANDATGFEAAIVIDRNPTLELVLAVNHHASTVITYDEWFTDWLSSGPTTHNISWTHSSGTNAIAFSYPTAQLIQPNIRDNGGIRDFMLQYKLQNVTAESEWSITMGA
jgi:hypothetical protein